MKTLISLLSVTCFFVFFDLKSQVPEKPFYSFGFETNYKVYKDFTKTLYELCYVDEQNGSILNPKVKLARGNRALLQRSGAVVVNLPLVDLTGFSQVDLSFDLGAYSTKPSQGLDKADSVYMYIVTDGGEKKCLRINGNDNKRVGIEEGDTTVFDYNSDDNYICIEDNKGAHTHFVLKNLPTGQIVEIRFRIKVDRSEECWILDNCELRGRREDSWGNYNHDQVQSIESHTNNKLAILGKWTAEQVLQLAENLQPILPTLKELDIVNADFADDADIDYLLDGASELCNIYAGDMLPDTFDGIFKGVNPNCLLHTTELSPQKGTNVVKGNYAELISFIDVSPCRIDRFIKFHKASFIKNFPKEIESGYNGKSGGWQTISLPFRAIEFYALDKDGAAMKPFGQDKDFDYENYLPFWIKNTDTTGVFQNWDKIGANYPYIVSVPNNPAYQDRYRIWGDVSFVGTDDYLWPTSMPNDKTLKELNADKTFKQFTFHPNVEGESLSREIYTMNEDGSAFVLTPSPLSPFASCLLFDGPQSEAPKRVNIMSDGAIVSSILKPEKADNKEIKVVQVGTYLKISSEIEQKVRICNLHGFIVKTLSFRANQEQYVSLAPGVYLINNKKIQQF